MDALWGMRQEISHKGTVKYVSSLSTFRMRPLQALDWTPTVVFFAFFFSGVAFGVCSEQLFTWRSYDSERVRFRKCRLVLDQWLLVAVNSWVTVIASELYYVLVLYLNSLVRRFAWKMRGWFGCSLLVLEPWVKCRMRICKCVQWCDFRKLTFHNADKKRIPSGTSGESTRYRSYRAPGKLQLVRRKLNSNQNGLTLKKERRFIQHPNNDRLSKWINALKELMVSLLIIRNK